VKSCEWDRGTLKFEESLHWVVRALGGGIGSRGLPGASAFIVPDRASFPEPDLQSAFGLLLSFSGRSFQMAGHARKLPSLDCLRAQS